MKNKKGQCDADGVCWALEGRIEMQGWSDYGFEEIAEHHPVTGERTLYAVAYYREGGNRGTGIYVKHCLFCGGKPGKGAYKTKDANNNTAQCDIDDVCRALADQIECERLSDYGFEKISDEETFVGVAYRSETDSDGTDVYISHCPFCGGRPGEIVNRSTKTKEEPQK